MQEDDPERPDYLPAPVWNLWLDLQGGPADTAATRRVLGLAYDAPDDIGRTWRRLARQIDAAARPLWAESDWRLLLDLFWSLPHSFDPGAYQARRRAAELAPRIAALAAELAAALDECEGLANRHDLSIPDEGLGTAETVADIGRAFEGFEPLASPRFADHANAAEVSQSNRHR